jgi:hypothetical protein
MHESSKKTFNFVILHSQSSKVRENKNKKLLFSIFGFEWVDGNIEK